jgi:hypothetical protein
VPKKLLTALYTDPETGLAISTHSMMKTFRRCPKQAEYKYVERLTPKVASKPLSQGTWMHKLQEVELKGGDWEAEHRAQTKIYNGLMDEEKEWLGDLPTECERMMKSYLWHYRKHRWVKIHEVEFVLETTFPNGIVYRGRIDLLAEDETGLWIVDHKWMKSLPNHDFRILDAASALYIWAAIQNDIPVRGHIWNYGVRKPPSIPKLVYVGKPSERLSRAKCDTDYPTLKRAIKDYGLNPADYKDWLDQLKGQQYRWGQPQMSTHFRRNVLEKTPAMLKRVAQEAHHTSTRMHTYPFHKSGYVERVPDRSCSFMCSYTDLCTLELMGGETRLLRRQKYRSEDPMYYYFDDPKTEEKDAA